MNPLTWIKIGGGLLLAAAIYLAGDSAGANRVIARDAKANARIVAAGARILQSARTIDVAAAQRDASRQEEVRKIYVEVPKLVDRPVYHNVCGDADGVRLLERSVAAANGELDGIAGSAGAAGQVQQPANPH